MNTCSNYKVMKGENMKKLVRWTPPTNDAKDDAECYCPDCDYYIENEDWKFCPMCGIGIALYEHDLDDSHDVFKKLEELGVEVHRNGVSINDVRNGKRVMGRLSSFDL